MADPLRRIQLKLDEVCDETTMEYQKRRQDKKYDERIRKRYGGRALQQHREIAAERHLEFKQQLEEVRAEAKRRLIVERLQQQLEEHREHDADVPRRLSRFDISQEDLPDDDF